MIENILTKVKDSSALEVQFRLGHKTIAKVKNEWLEIDKESLGYSEWEDLKDLCLQNNDKLTLETKGFVRGVYKSIDQQWTFSFTEHKDCLKAYFSVIPSFELSQYIQSPVFWDSLKKSSGLFIVTGQRGQGKSSLLKDIISEIKKDSPKLIAVHGHFSSLSMLNNDSLIHLSEETLGWDAHHPIYDGIDQFVVDFNSIKNWEKWIKLCEEGRSVYVTISGLSVENCFEQIVSQIGFQSNLARRFYQVLNSVCYQKVIGVKEGAVHEFFVAQQSFKEDLFKMSFADFKKHHDGESFKKYFQSLNQSIIQALVRRRIDVKSAFAASDAPDELDNQLKRMGL